MYLRNMIRNVSKYAHAYVKLNKFVENNIQLNIRCTAFINHHLRTGATTQKDYYDKKQKFNKREMPHLFIISGGIFFGLFGSDEEEEKDKEPDVIMTLKRSIFLIQKGEFQKAEQMLHLALRQAQTIQDNDGITYVYDVMANLAFDTEDYVKAEKLFVTVLQRLLSDGVEPNDLRVIHISLKMAKAYEYMGDIKKAEHGYRFCIENLRTHRIEDNENEDVMTLLGMAADWYAHMLLSETRYKEALKYYTEAYDLFIKVNGTEQEQAVILLNDLGTVTCLLGQYDKAIDYLSTAEELGNKMPEMVDLASIHINLGTVFMKKGLYEEAKKSCTKGKIIAENRNDNDALIEAKGCLEELLALLS